MLRAQGSDRFPDSVSQLRHVEPRFPRIWARTRGAIGPEIEDHDPSWDRAVATPAGLHRSGRRSWRS